MAVRPRSLLLQRLAETVQVYGAAKYRLLTVGFSCLDQTVKLSAGRRALWGEGAEPPVLSPLHEGPDCTLCYVVVDR